MTRNNILNRLMRKAKLKRIMSNVLGIGLALTLGSAPTYLMTKQRINQTENYRKEKIAENILALSTNLNQVDKLLVPYLKEHPSFLSSIPDDYESLQKLQSILNETGYPLSITGTNLETKLNVSPKLIVDGMYRVDIDGKPYFSVRPLSDNLEFFPEINALWDKGNFTLYHISENQRLEEPILDVQDVISKKNKIYVHQGTSLFNYENGKMVWFCSHVRDKMKEIEGTSFHIVFTDKGAQIITGQETEEQEKLAKNLQSKLRDLKFSDSPFTKSRLVDGNFYLNDEYGFTSVPLQTNNPSWSIPSQKRSNPLILDYLILPSSDSNNNSVVFYQRECSEGSTNYTFAVFCRIMSGTNITENSYKIGCSNLGSDYCFPKITNSNDLLWLTPRVLKEKVKTKLGLK